MPQCTVCGSWIQPPEVHICEGVKIPMMSLVKAKVIVPLKPSGNIGHLHNEILNRIFKLLDERSLGLIALVCSKWRPFSIRLLGEWVPTMFGHGSTTTNLKTQITKYLVGAKTVELAVDQFPYPGKGLNTSVLGYILNNNIALNLALGTNDPKTRNCLLEASQKYTHVTTKNKMHNKIWVIDKEGVILGSPNVSFAGLQGGNLESCIMIKSLRAGHLFRRYLELVRCPKPESSPLWDEISSALTKYNSESHKLKLAFAPIMQITDFVADNLPDGVTKIVVRQFLISSATGKKGSKDILGVLCGLAKAGTDIEIYIDDQAWETFPFVKEAASQLIKAGCKVFTQTPVLVINARNEGIQHDKLILATLHDGVCRTMIGSAGFTRDVIANNNWENFICTDVQSIHDSLMAHHLRTLDSKVATTFTIKS